MFMLQLLIGVGLGVLATLATQWALRLRERRLKPETSKVLEFPHPPDGGGSGGGGFVDSILSEESEDEVVERLRRNLRVKVFHDESNVERLLESERRRQPDASMRVLLEAAIERWERDNR